jgi:hypothetical protein
MTNICMVVSITHNIQDTPGWEQPFKQNLTWSNLTKDAEATVKTCHQCQNNKKVRRNYDHLHEPKAEKS